jgi:hypothetical protein
MSYSGTTKQALTLFSLAYIQSIHTQLGASASGPQNSDPKGQRINQVSWWTTIRDQTTSPIDRTGEQVGPPCGAVGTRDGAIAMSSKPPSKARLALATTAVAVDEICVPWLGPRTMRACHLRPKPIMLVFCTQKKKSNGDATTGARGRAAPWSWRRSGRTASSLNYLCRHESVLRPFFEVLLPWNLWCCCRLVMGCLSAFTGWGSKSDNVTPIRGGRRTRRVGCRQNAFAFGAA